MAYTVNWITKVITIPLSDLTFVSGVNYSLTADDAHKELRRLEWEVADGLWATQIVEFVETQTLSGIPYSPIVKIINGYTWFVDATDIVVPLLGSNSNLLDTFIPGNGVSVLANNSGGKIVSGSGLSAEQDATLTAIDTDVGVLDTKADTAQLDITDIHDAHFKKRVWDSTADTITLYDTDNVTPLHVFDTNDDMSDITPQ